jgi:hypothetical protein
VLDAAVLDAPATNCRTKRKAKNPTANPIAYWSNLDRMRGGRWKVFRGQNDGWLEEYRLYHRDERGLLVKDNDDAISASRYALMMIGRYGETSVTYAPRSFSGLRRLGGWMSA